MISLARGTRKAARKVADRILHAAPLALWRKLVPKTELGVCYHVVSDGPVPHIKHYRFLDTDTFESDLDYLRRRFEFVTYAELTRRRTSAIRSRGNAVILTFDDGFAECATVVAPLLRRRGLRCVFFVITDLIDNQVLFRESAASLCIEAIIRMPFDQVESIMAEFGLGALLRPSPGASLSEPTTTRPFGLADLDPNLDPQALAAAALVVATARERGGAGWAPACAPRYRLSELPTASKALPHDRADTPVTRGRLYDRRAQLQPSPAPRSLAGGRRA